jgi:peptidoglycan/xylan/chitin deacetylase (PgdA/CDA1 family)
VPDKVLQVAVTCDDVGNARHSHPLGSLKEFVSILDGNDVKGTFFVIPNDGGDSPLYEDPDLVSTLGTIMDKGHEVAMHGYTHHILEFGPPRPFILRIDATAIYLSEMERREQEIQSYHTLESHLGKIRKGLEIFQRALNFRPVGFRAGWGSYNSNMFEALSKEGFLYDSSIFKSEGREKKGNKPYLISGLDKIVEFPMDLDYGWCLFETDLEVSLKRAKEAVERSDAEGEVFVPLLHHWAMARYDRLGLTYDFTTGFTLLEKLIKHLKFNVKTRFVTLQEAHREIGA